MIASVLQAALKCCVYLLLVIKDRVNSNKNVTEGESFTHLEMLPGECRLLSFRCIGQVRVLPQAFQRLVDCLP